MKQDFHKQKKWGGKMREILFRGKHTGNCGWVYGYLCDHRGDERVDVCGETISDFYIRNWMEVGTDIYGCNYAVDPATVGEYTGLEDKNGKKIFEGDVCAVDIDAAYFKIAWDDENAMFQLLGDGLCFDFNNCYTWQVEVIGNIHDNPELLEGDGEK